MSINSAMLAGVSGLVANSAALAAISDNIANVNTTGYKEEETDFESVVTAAAGKGAYNAGGVLADVNQMVTQQGLLQQTTSSTDLGIQGQGFFVVTNKATGLTASDARSFTRAGSFQVDSQGYLRNAAGYYLQGWPVNAQGQITTDPSNLSLLSSINVSAVGGAANPTTTVTVNANLESSQTVSPAALAAAGVGTAAAYDPSTNSMAMYDPTTGVGRSRSPTPRAGSGPSRSTS
jgi:flagellar hook protein FlgE